MPGTSPRGSEFVRKSISRTTPNFVELPSRSTCFVPSSLSPKSAPSIVEQGKDEAMLTNISFLHVELKHLQEQMEKERASRRRHEDALWAEMANVKSEYHLRTSLTARVDSESSVVEKAETRMTTLRSSSSLLKQAHEGDTEELDDDTILTTFESRCCHLDAKLDHILHQVGTTDMLAAALELRMEAFEQHLGFIQKEVARVSEKTPMSESVVEDGAGADVTGKRLSTGDRSIALASEGGSTPVKSFTPRIFSKGMSRMFSTKFSKGIRR